MPLLLVNTLLQWLGRPCPPRDALLLRDAWTQYPPGPLPAGTRVLVQRLVAKPEHNGRHARVLSFDAGTGRYVVTLDDGKELELKADCVARAGYRCHICAGTGLTPATSAPGLGSPLPRRHRDWAHPSHVCTGTALTPATSAPGLGSPLANLHRDLGATHACEGDKASRSVWHALHTLVVCSDAAGVWIASSARPTTTSAPGLAPLPHCALGLRPKSRRRCGRGKPSPGADVARASPVPAQMWHG
jgi:hypothetical protein